MLRAVFVVSGLFAVVVVGGGVMGDFGLPTVIDRVSADDCYPHCIEGPDPGGCHPSCDILESPCRPHCLGDNPCMPFCNDLVRPGA